MMHEHIIPKTTKASRYHALYIPQQSYSGNDKPKKIYKAWQWAAALSYILPGIVGKDTTVDKK